MKNVIGQLLSVVIIMLSLKFIVNYVLCNSLVYVIDFRVLAVSTWLMLRLMINRRITLTIATLSYSHIAYGLL